MRVAHVIDDFSPRNGGLTTALEQLALNLRPLGVQSTIYSAAPDGPGNVASKTGDASDTVICPTNRWGARWRLSSELYRRLGEDLGTFDVVHVHGIWRAPQLMGLIQSRVHRLPTVLSPHNMLGGWLWRRSLAKRIKKYAYFNTLKRVYRSATRIHALSPVEAEVLKPFFPETPIDIVPNGIDVAAATFAYDPTQPRYFLYLGRLYEGKGIELLLQAFAQFSGRAQFRLVLAGQSSNARYEHTLRSLARSLGIEPALEWTGQVAGADKARLLGEASAVFLPSFSEGVSMVALETLAAATPLVASREIGVPEIGEHGGSVVELNAASLLSAMHEVARWTSEERALRGQRSRELALNRYAWSAVAPQFLALYQRTLMA